MDEWEREGFRSANKELRYQIADIMDAYERQRVELAEVQQQMTAVRCTATSSDGLIAVTVDIVGVVTDVQLEPQALHTTSEKLGKSIAETAKQAARLAQQRAAEMATPVTDIVGAMPDLPDMLPGAPSLRESTTSIEEATASTPIAAADDDYYDDDDYDLDWRNPHNSSRFG
ncbi:YbaB/EbfC family nucleoid-associated protein [Nocardia sp. CWNU-33]|uniref:YbaB/EbfC family nucleoid-associated protein n=1 Tax=Nocardia sp. CWNU-33 TaxID=3392117 RepID=UPI00398EF5AC